MTTLIWLNRLRVMTLKELLQLGRDIALIVFALYGFTADVYMAGSGFTYELHDTPFAVADSDHSALSRELIGRFHAPIFDLAAGINKPEQATSLLDRGKVVAALNIPPDFAKNLQAGRRTSLQLEIDATNTVPALLFSSYATQIVAEYGLEQSLASAGFSGTGTESLPVVNDEMRVWYNPNLTDSWFMALVELFTIISILALMLPAAALVREKEKGTIEQLRVSPLSSVLIILPKIVSMLIVILAGSFVSLFLIIHLLFGMPFQGNLVLFFAMTALYVFATASIGIAAASVVRTQGQVAMLIILLIMPMLLLSGSWTPPEAMPELMRRIIVVSPLYHYLNAGLGIMFRNASIVQIWSSVLGLVTIGGVAFAFSLWRVQRQ